MKLTDFLDNVGRPIAYYPKMKKITGSTTATILLCQFIYWRGKEADSDGWLYKTSEEIESETGLSYNEQKTARKDLLDAGLVKEHYARLDHQMRFKLDLEAINEKWGMLEPQIPESDNPSFGKDDSPYSLNSNTENTSENTTYEISAKEDKKHSEISGEYNTKFVGHATVIKGELNMNGIAEDEEVNTLMRGDWRDYPEHLHEVAKCLRDTWMFVLPEKPKKGSKKSQYAFFVMAMESIKQSCGEFGIKAMEETHKKWKAGFKGGLAPYTIAQPTSIINTVAGTALEMRQGGSSDVKSTGRSLPNLERNL